ncbi:MAG: hypothetical protein PHQ23_17350 [Candidatus Wallbacteria bacterium]|nr:hypothetical protein [Candidatus Wallbacteria bacterium]
MKNLIFLLTALSVLAIAGCGGGGGGSTGGAAAVPDAQAVKPKGQVSVSLEWPESNPK